jgi:hypothetical protein
VAKRAVAVQLEEDLLRKLETLASELEVSLDELIEEHLRELGGVSVHGIRRDEDGRLHIVSATRTIRYD